MKTAGRNEFSERYEPVTTRERLILSARPYFLVKLMLKLLFRDALSLEMDSLKDPFSRKCLKTVTAIP